MDHLSTYLLQIQGMVVIDAERWFEIPTVAPLDRDHGTVQYGKDRWYQSQPVPSALVPEHRRSKDLSPRHNDHYVL